MILLQFNHVVVPEKLDLNVKSWRLDCRVDHLGVGIPTFLMFYCLVGHNFQDTAWNRRYQYAKGPTSCSQVVHVAAALLTGNGSFRKLGLKECKGRSLHL